MQKRGQKAKGRGTKGWRAAVAGGRAGAPAPWQNCRELGRSVAAFSGVLVLECSSKERYVFLDFFSMLVRLSSFVFVFVFASAGGALKRVSVRSDCCACGEFAPPIGTQVQVQGKFPVSVSVLVVTLPDPAWPDPVPVPVPVTL